jgi:uncharacterized membrane protein
MFNVVLFFHLFAALLFVSGIVVVGVAFESARRRTRPAEIVVLLRLTRVGVLLVAVGGLLLPIFGLWLVHLGHWSYGTGWIDWALGLYLLALLLGAIGGQRPKRARQLAARLTEQDAPISDELRALLSDPVALVLNYVSLLMVLAILALMAFKP